MVKITEKNIVKVKKLYDDVELPEYALESDVGFDIRANETISFEVGQQKTVKTGIAIEIPKGHVGLIRDRAGIMTKMGLHTAAGTFDPDFRGEVSIVLINCGDQEVQVEKGMRIAQMLILPITKVEIKQADELSKTKRDTRGFSSTGVKEIIRELEKLNHKPEK